MMARRADVTLCGGWKNSLEADQPYIDRLSQINVRVTPRRLPNYSNALLDRFYDVVWFELGIIARQALSRTKIFQPHARTIVDSVDIHFDREWSGVAVGAVDRETAARNEVNELAAYRAADVVVVVSEADKALLSTRPPMPPLEILPNIVPLRNRPSVDRLKEALFVGGFLHHPNVDGLLWFTSEVWPLVIRQVPEAKLTIVGANAPQEIVQLGRIPGITVVGYVTDTGPYLDRAMISVAPLRYGGGMKGKVNEAMAAGLPVVTTRFGVQGIGGTSGTHFLVADDPAAFAQEVVSLFQFPAHADAMGQAAKAFVSDRFTPEAVERQLGAFFERLAVPHRANWYRAAWQCKASLQRPALKLASVVQSAFRRS